MAEKGEVNIDSKLYPFIKSSKSFYTSNDLRDWKKARFAMPGSADLDDESRETIKEYVRNNYYWYDIPLRTRLEALLNEKSQGD